MRDQRLDRRAPLVLPDWNHGDRLRTPQPPSPGPATGGHPGSLAASRWPCCRSDHSASPLGPPTHSSPKPASCVPGLLPPCWLLAPVSAVSHPCAAPVGCEALFSRKQHLRVCRTGLGVLVPQTGLPGKGGMNLGVAARKGSCASSGARPVGRGRAVLCPHVCCCHLFPVPTSLHTHCWFLGR